MMWNWQQPDWPNFFYDSKPLISLENKFLHNSGLLFGAFKHVNEIEKQSLIVEIIGEEALQTSAIEGEYLNRDSIQSSIRHNFGLATDSDKVSPAERGIADMLTDLYAHFAQPLNHKILFRWHTMLTTGRHDLTDVGRYRSHQDPMLVVSGPIHKRNILFEAPPSSSVRQEMNQFMRWFHSSAPSGKTPLPALTRAGIAHLYFVSIHPFEDGNGRIGRALAEKALAEQQGRPTLIALSHTIEKHRKRYYNMLERSNRSNEITAWLVYFTETLLEAQIYTQNLIDFLIKKAKLYNRLRGQLNPRQEKVLARMLRKGLGGFEGGLSVANYIAITRTSRATASRDLQDLVTKTALLRTGTLKSTRYYLKLDEQ